MHREFNDVFLDFAHSVSGLEFAVRASVGSHAFLMIFFFMVSGIAAWGRRHKEDFFEGWWPFLTTWPIWGVIGCFVLISFCFLYKSIHQITSVPPVRFIRQRREVAYVRQQGEPPLIVLWEEVIACVTVGTTVNPYAVTHSYSLMIGLRDSTSGEVVWLTLNVGHLSLAVSEWEALRVYMEEGPLALPEPLLVTKSSRRAP
ncbi:hypothetical protein NTD86_15835 [Pseudomonas sp. 7P_10.2_Bac1]|uniref:hypothetical protein n=1 Tax=Pseudomonas sp. 7P_10.2_Bac1 TaxID=2971614 RepID=UPI0021C9DE98|nr:hypothetical protein [Pseudomonas sp. 7P_10.2_Bac1]MCU1728456.1 hypothetical protein [Pseudomonas sp. 7P_10.2_Bac1]